MLLLLLLAAVRASGTTEAEQVAGLQAFADLNTGTPLPWNFSQPESYCSFLGVECDADGAVVGVYLTDEDLAGNLTTMLDTVTDLLPAMQTVSLGGNNELQGSLPEQLGPNMTGLWVAVAGLTGTFPQALFTSQMIAVNVGGSQLTGSLPEAPSPCGLEIWKSNVVPGVTGTLPASWDNCTSLVSLQVRYMHLDAQAAPGAHWPAIETYMLNNWTAVTGTLPSILSTSEVLRDLSIHNSPFLTGSVPQISNANMETLVLEDLDGQSQLTGSIPTALSTWTALQALSINGLPLITGGLPPLPDEPCQELQTIEVSNCPGLAPTTDELLQWLHSECTDTVFVLIFHSVGATGPIPADVFNASVMPTLVTAQFDNPDTDEETDSFDCPLPESLFCRSPYESYLYTAPRCGDVCAPWVDSSSGTTLDLAWGCLGVEFHDELIGFRVLVAEKEFGIECDSPVGCEVLDRGALACTVEGLVPSTEYVVRLLPLYSWGPGYSWYDNRGALGVTEIPATTTNGLPAAPGFEVSSVTATSVTVQWEPLTSVADTGGLAIERYVVSVTSGARQRTCLGLATDTECTVGGLTPLSNYAVDVVAENAQGAGPAAASSEIYTCSLLQRSYGAQCYDCFSGSGCDGSADCRPGFEGELCGLCRPGTYHYGGECVECDGVPWAMLIMFLVVVACIPVIDRVTTRSRAMSTLFATFITTCQLSTVIFGYVATYSELGQKTVGGWTSIFAATPGELQMECTDGWTFYYQHVMVVYAVPLVAVGAASLVVYRVKKRLAVATAAGDVTLSDSLQQRRAKLLSAGVLLFSLYATPLSRGLLQIYGCGELPSGTTVLLVDPRLHCHTDTHTLLAVAASVTLTALLGSIAYAAWLLRQLARQDRLEDPDVLRAYGPAYWRHKDRFAGFEAVVLSRKLLLVGIGVLLTRYATAQATLGVAITVGYTYMCARWKPFASAKRSVQVYSYSLFEWLDTHNQGTVVDITNVSETLGAALLTLVQLYALVVVTTSADAGIQNGILAVIIAFFALYGLWIVLAARRELQRGFRDPNKRKRGEELVQELKIAEASMREQAQLRRFHFAQELLRSVLFMRKASSPSSCSSSSSPSPSSETEAEAEVEVEDLAERLKAVNEEALAQVRAGCSLCNSDDGTCRSNRVGEDEVVASWSSALRELERAASDSEQYRVAEYCRRWAPTRLRAVREERASHAQAHVVSACAALQSALDAHDYGLAHTELCGADEAIAQAPSWRARRRVQRMLYRAHGEVSELVRVAAPADQRSALLKQLHVGLGGGGGRMSIISPQAQARTEAGAEERGEGVHDFARWATWTFAAANAAETVAAKDISRFSQARQRRRRLLRRAAALLALVAGVAVMVLVLTAGNGDAVAASGGGSSDSGDPSDCGVYEVTNPATVTCDANLGRVGSLQPVGFLSPLDIEATMSVVAATLPLMLASGSVVLDNPDECFALLLEFLCEVSFPACVGNCTTTLRPCHALCEPVAYYCGDLEAFERKVGKSEVQQYLDAALTPSDVIAFNRMTEFLGDCTDSDPALGVWGDPDDCSYPQLSLSLDEADIQAAEAVEGCEFSLD